MPISRVILKNCKSIRSLEINFNQINCLLGENGTGKTNVLKAIKYFNDNLTGKNIDSSLYDKVNPYINSFEITIFYDFTRLLKITEIHIERNSENPEYKVNPIFKKIKNLHKSLSNDKNEVEVTLIQDKNGIQKWNVSYEIRSFIKSIFPIYFSQTRHINLINWDDLWEIIGELSKVGLSESASYRTVLEECFKSAFGDKYSTILGYIENEMQKNDIEVKSFNSNQKFAAIYQLQLGGNNFKHKFENLEYFSDGINSYNYLILLINLVSKISDKKIKEPFIIIDEPEIGLHPKYLDKMVSAFFNKSKHINILISTHSPRMIKSLMQDNKIVNMYHLSMNKNYTKLSEMKGFTDARESKIITEQEASYYFAKCIVFVEGITEMELFSNNNLVKLFPFLKEIDFFPYDGNSVKLRTIHPNEKNISIPYIILIDFDKILSYKRDSKEFSLKKGDKFMNPLKDNNALNKERFFYGKKRINTNNARKRINGILSKSKFYFDEEWGYIKGTSEYYSLLKSLIKTFSLKWTPSSRH
ncbi:retron Eco8 family effector endonuclease [Niallia sp. FSL R7-0648]|uniref:retron Eco8 family effector endonuclease n=1 Tax=Niallia sp. FSL R7-0648 TaxID=2954521 RepID=UPI0030FC8DAF